MPQQSQRNWTIILVVPSFWNPYPPMMGWSLPLYWAPNHSAVLFKGFKGSANLHNRRPGQLQNEFSRPESPKILCTRIVALYWFPTNRYDSLLVLFFHEKCLLWKRLQFLSRMCSEVKGAKLVKWRLKFEVWISHGVRCDLFHRQGVNRFLRSKQKQRCSTNILLQEQLSANTTFCKKLIGMVSTQLPKASSAGGRPYQGHVS